MEQRKSGETRSTQGSEARRCCKTVSLSITCQYFIDDVRMKCRCLSLRRPRSNRPNRLLESPRLGKVARALGVRVRHDRRRACLLTLDDALHVGRGLRGHDHHRRAGAAPCHPPRHRQAPCRHLFRAQCGGHPCGVVFAQKLAGLKLVSSARKGKEAFFSATAEGRMPACATARCARPA